MTTNNPTPTQQGQTLEGCPFCSSVPSRTSSGNWWFIRHERECFITTIDQRDQYIDSPKIQSWSTRRTAVAGPRGDLLAELFDLFEKDGRGRWCFKSLSRDDRKFDGIMDQLAAATASPTPAEPRICVKCRHSNFNRVQGECDEPDSENIFCGCKCEFAPAERTRVEGEQRLLTPEELADIERFQQQRRKSPVAEDAWLYVAEIDRLLTHIRLDREQLENEIFQDATDPNFAAAPADNDAELLLQHVAYSGVEFDDNRMGYVAVQIDRDVWEQIQKLAPTTKGDH